ncbi:MAG: pilus assembly protein PilM [Verrucomicrobia bacterium]|nr:pilus assembly protein PilM [Verrucomicrobiota bacterium]
MSNSSRLIINCGTSRVTAARVSAQTGSVKLEQIATEYLEIGSVTDDNWIDAVNAALKELVRSNNLQGSATFILPGNQVLTKSIKIPHVEAEKRAQIIAFEAQQSIPYPLHEIVWDSQIIGDDGIETEVLFIACKIDTIESFCAGVRAAGLTAESITAASILEYNLLSFADPEASSDDLVINIGARTTNLLFRNAEGFFVRNLTLGGQVLSQSIADSLGKTLEQAEVIKLQFYNKDNEILEDSTGAKAFTDSADAFMRRVSQEVTRSIVNYRRQKNAPAPGRILLSGRGSQVRGLADFLQSSQKVPVERLDPLEYITLDAGINEGPENLSVLLPQIIGEACRPFVESGAGVNLLPEAVQAAMRFAKQKPLLLAAAVCLALAPWPAWKVFNGKIAACDAQIAALQTVADPFLRDKAAIAENVEKAEAVKSSIQRVEGLVQSKSNWIQFFAELQASMTGAEDVWLDGLQVLRQVEDGVPTYEVALEGQMLVRETVNGTQGIDRDILTRRIRSLIENFKTSAFIVDSKPPRIRWSMLNDGLNVLPFEIKLVVDAAKPL